MKRVILDTDPGIDDALAIILALNSPEIELVGITTVCGNVYVDRAVKNVYRILRFMDRMDIPVYRGAYKPIINEPNVIEDIHGTDGLGDIDLPTPDEDTRGNAIQFILEEVNEKPNEVTIVALGPLTNIAMAILIDPEFSGKVDKIISMGGAFALTPYGYGNDTPVAEFNVYTDPEAAKIVYDSGAEIYAVGLDISRDPGVSITPEEREFIRDEGGRCGKLFYEMTRKMINISSKIHLHDPLALSYIIDENILRFRKHNVRVELEGKLTRGATIVDKRTWLPKFLVDEPNVYVAVKVDGERFKTLMWDRVFSR